MADDLKIQVTAELDESSSAARIKSQIAHIASSTKNTPIKPQIAIDNAQVERAARTVRSALERSLKNIKVTIDPSQFAGAIEKVAKQAASVTAKATKAASADMQRAAANQAKSSQGGGGERLRQNSRHRAVIEQRAEELRRLKAKESGKLVDYTISRDAVNDTYVALIKYQVGANKAMQYTIKFDEALQDAVVTQERLSESIGKTEAQRAKQIENTKNFAQKYEAELKKLNSRAFNQDDPLSKEFSGDFEAKLKAARSKLSSIGETINKDFEREFKAMFSDAQLALVEAQKKQWGATDFSSKDVTKQIVGEEYYIGTLEAKAKAAGVATAEVATKIQGLRDALAGVSDMPGLQKVHEDASNLSKEITMLQTKATAIKKDWNVKGQVQADKIDTDYIAKLQSLLAHPTLRDAQTPGLTAIRSELQKVSDEAKRVSNAFKAGNLDAAQFEQLGATFKALTPSISAAERAAKLFDGTIGSQKNLQRMSTELKTVQMNIDGLADKYSAFMKDAAARGMYENLKSFSAVADVSNKSQLQKEASQFTAYLKNNGLDRRSLWDEVKNNFSKFSSWFGIASVVTGGIRAFNEMTDSVSQVNKQMTELKKVTDETDTTYAKFLKNAGSRSKDIGTDLPDYVKSVADWSRMGKSLKDATVFGEASNILYKVGDEFANVDDATNTLITTTKAYGIEVNDVMSIVDRLNAVSNQTSASSGGLADSLRRSASALAMAGMDLNKSLGLIVAGNETVRDYEKTGTAIRTMSLRMRGATTELESMGEEVDEFAKSTPKLRAEIKALSGVDIMKDKNTFKDVYDVLEEISQVQDKLTDVSKARVMEVMFGKQQGNVGASILQNFSEAQRAVSIAQESAGSAMAEHAKWMQSVEAAQTRASSAFQEFSNTILSSGLITGYYDAKSGFLGFLTQIIDKLGTLPTLATAAAGVLSAKNFGIYNMPMRHPLGAAA